MPGYPTPPGPRIAYDLDGTIGFITGLFSKPGMTPVAPNYLRALNSDSPRVATSRVGILRPEQTGNYTLSYPLDFPLGHAVAIRFPEPMRIRALAIATLWGLYYSGRISQNTGPGILQCMVETSDDSTNGEDGTWRQLYAHMQNDLFPLAAEDPTRADETYGYVTYAGSEGTDQSVYPSVNSNYRRQSTGPGEPGWRAVTGSATRQVTWLRIRPFAGVVTPNYVSSGSVAAIGTGYKLHLYGEPDTAASTDRLIFTDVSGNLKSSFNWGDIGQGSEHVQTFKVKNTSDIKTATGVSVGIQTPNPSVLESPQVWDALSVDGVAWSNLVMLPDLAPGSSSDTITLRVQAGTSVVGPSGPRISADVEEWV